MVGLFDGGLAGWVVGSYIGCMAGYGHCDLWVQIAHAAAAPTTHQEQPQQQQLRPQCKQNTKWLMNSSGGTLPAAPAATAAAAGTAAATCR